MSSLKVLHCFGFLVLILEEIHCVSFEEDVTISRPQKVLIDKLREQVLPYIVEDYMKDDIYIVKWLRRTNFNLAEAEKLFLENIKWRKESGMTTIEREDFSDVAKDYPYMQSGFDRQGRPVMVAFAGDWDIRNAVMTGRVDRVVNFVIKGIELLERQIRQLQAEGKNVTQLVLVMEISEFSLVTHACVQCLFRVLNFLMIYENHFPGLADKILFVGAPPAVGFVIDLIKQNASKETRDAIQVYGPNRAQWQKILHYYISKENLPVELGGSIENPEYIKS